MTETPTQDYKTHRRFVPGYHFVTFLLLLLNLGWAGAQLVRRPGVGAAITFGFALAVAMLFFYARQFVTTVQDRVIRLEERLRLARLLPADLQGRIEELTPDQLVGLRFASDGEVAELVRAVLTQDITDCEAIKRMIKVWRPDFLRA